MIVSALLVRTVSAWPLLSLVSCSSCISFLFLFFLLGPPWGYRYGGTPCLE